jgi:4-phytase/acid phosphatase
MLRYPITRMLILFVCCVAASANCCLAQSNGSQAKQGGAELKFVLILSRHGIRSPTHDASAYDRYSRAAWPQWDVPPGYLTPHGFEDMKLLGAWDRGLLAREGLISETGCADAGRVAIVADSGQRTRQSGLALAEGMFPGCPPAVHALPEGTRNALFHPMRRESDPARVSSLAEARMWATQRNLTRRFHLQIEHLDHILAQCGSVSSPYHRRISLFDAPYAPRPGRAPHLGQLRGPLSIAATLSENLLLEYAEDMPLSNVGWGCVNEDTLRALMVLHTAAFDYEHRNPAEARMSASNLLAHVLTAMEQSVSGRAVPGAPDVPNDRVLFLVGHDTNLAAVAALLHLNWTADGRRDDTPPGSAVEFDLWRSRSGAYFVRLFFATQTLDEMRNSTALTPAHPPVRVPLAIPGCGTAADGVCSWTDFSRLSRHAVDPTAIDLVGQGVPAVRGVPSRTDPRTGVRSRPYDHKGASFCL